MRFAPRAPRSRSGRRMTAYNRGQVLYRIAEMIESRTAEFAELCTGRDEVERSIDRIVWYAGWADKLAQVIGGVESRRRAVLQLHAARADGRRRRHRAGGAAAPRHRFPCGAGDRRRQHRRGADVGGASARGDRARRGDRDVRRAGRRRQRADRLPRRARAVAGGARRRQRARRPRRWTPSWSARRPTA